MTTEKLCGMSADQLDKITEGEWKAYCDAYLVVTRPELAPKPIKKSNLKTPSYAIKEKRQEAMDILKKFGMGHIKI